MHQRYNFLPIRVIDGDTFQGKVVLSVGEPLLGIYTQTEFERNIRLHIVDTPEYFGKTYLDEEKELARRIKTLVEKIFQSSDKLEFEPTNKPDSFGRLIGEVWVYQGGTEFPLSEFLYDNGLALLYGERSHHWTVRDNCYKAMETCDNLLELF